VGNFNAKIGREGIFKPVIGSGACMKHQMKMGSEQLILPLIII
jgi:hypothetical protein